MIYFVKCGDLVKIGTTSNDVQARLSNLQTGNPAPMVLLGQMAGGAHAEAELHRRFRTLHVRGEWFRYSDDLRTFIADIDDGAEPYGLLNGDSLFFGLFVPGEHYRTINYAYAQATTGKWWHFGGVTRPSTYDPVEHYREIRKRGGLPRPKTVLCAFKNATRFGVTLDPALQRLLRKAQKVKEL